MKRNTLHVQTVYLIIQIQLIKAQNSWLAARSGFTRQQLFNIFSSSS